MGTKPATAGQPKNVLISVDRAEWRKICDLLNDGQYQHVAEYLLKKQTAAEQNNDLVLEHILAAAHQICLTCCQYRAEFELHQQACEDVAKCEREMQQQLAAMLGLASQHVESNLPVKAIVESPTLTADQFPPPSRGLSGLWQRIQNWLGRESHSKSVKLIPERKTEITLAGQSGRETAVALINPESHEKKDVPHLTVYCLGPFRAYLNEHLIDDWNGLKSPAILKYMLTQRGRPIQKDLLMEVFWPDADPEAARRNLHQAIYSLRQTLRQDANDFQHIQFHNDCYQLNPELSIWTDFQEFEAHAQRGRSYLVAGQLAAAMHAYGMAENLYQGDFLSEDIYEEWSRPFRHQLRHFYLEIADQLSTYHADLGEHTAALALCQKILTYDNCYEGAHRRLMQCYVAQGQRYLAVRQYQICAETLAEELDLAPSTETEAFYQEII